ncbi:hypothetical protein FHL15_008488 [Xylaria flabelliformis]|uniref:HMG box domain-containing protein n=1 Tax=Xylaria flabelliformis TaxID=2512241 RepID=A0A553HRZ8_9PEZI|nr:hypothetical protein FHL15_008488 [Xylaria flabelliformis]
MEYIDPQLLESSTSSEAEVQPVIANAVTEAQLRYPPREDGYVFQGRLPSYCHLTDFASPYPEAPLMESRFDFNNFDPYAPIPRSVAPDFTLPTYLQAPEPWSVTYPNFAPPPYPAGYPTSPVPAQILSQRPLPGTPVNEHFTRLQVRKESNNPGQSKNRGRKQPVRRPKGQKTKRPLLPEEVQKLTKPLSQLALESPHISVFDMDAHVRRDADKRMTLRRGEYKIRRPSNSFVLYRKAYSDHMKALVGVRQDAISRLAGASWKLESKEVKDKFDGYALEESRQHHAFFPGYKYLPKHHSNAEAEPDNETVLEEIWAEQ